MSGTIRLGCHLCDRCDFGEIDELPLDWSSVNSIQSLGDSCAEVGTCPDYQAEEQ